MTHQKSTPAADKCEIGKQSRLKDFLPRRTNVQGIEDSYLLQGKRLPPFYFVESTAR